METAMRKIKFYVMFIVLLGAGAALYWYTTKSTREAEVMDTREMVEPPPAVLEATPADSSAMADTISVH